MWNVNIHSGHFNRGTLLRGLEITLYGIIGALFVGQVYAADAVTLRESLLTMAGASLLMLVSTASAPVVSLLSKGLRSEKEERGRVIPFRAREATEQAQAQEEQRRAA